ncbi:hypothetical protein DFQ28_005986 [Apophysomyces sp. BC1034]|nr:hypothetical protein DFQ29_004916 [Apophysomyces sp. BC1021]KAG0187674.1 hypothetical protein DFQ28_005986 [Apophysomyces sp. BC1034]
MCYQGLLQRFAIAFSKHGTFYNGLVAIIAGLVANVLVDNFGFNAPYKAAMCLSTMTAMVIHTTWSENYGEQQIKHEIRLGRVLLDGCNALWSDSSILVLGAAQTFFECSMYTFVLLYIPVIESAAIELGGNDSEKTLPLGYLFSTLMFAVMLGSLAFQAIDRQATSSSPNRFFRQFTKDRLLALALGLASSAFAAMAYYERSSLSLLALAYHVFEFTTGLYYPSISSLKAESIPEETRAAVMTLLRIPMNVGVGIIMWHVDSLSTSMMFAICSVMAALGCSMVMLKYHHCK